MPVPDPEAAKKPIILKGDVPSPIAPPSDLMSQWLPEVVNAGPSAPDTSSNSKFPDQVKATIEDF